MADNANWRARPAGNAPRLGGMRWSSGKSEVGLSSGGKGSSKRGGKKRYVHSRPLISSNRNKTPKILPTHPHPLFLSNVIKMHYAHLLDRAKPQWVNNPKNVLCWYTQSRLGQPPQFDSIEGYVVGRTDIIVRCTAVLDEELNIIAIGDGKSQKEAERTAALHGMLMLMDRDFIQNPPPSIHGPATTKKGDELTIALSDGTALSLERAREFLDYVCHIGHFGKPEVVLSELKDRRGRRNVSAGWQAVIALGGTDLGKGVASSKKVAQNIAMLDTARMLEADDHDTWVRFNTTYKPGMAVGKAPHISFHVSNELEEQMRNLYDTIRRSEMYAKRPRTTAAYHAQEAPKEPRRERRPITHLTEQQHEEKSERMLQALNAYQVDDRVANIRAQRQSLPVMQKSGDVLVKIELNQVTICMAATGSGKTTQVPQILLDDYILRKQGSRCNIICTQPRRIAAISVAQRVAKERGESVGESIGYQVRFDHKLPRPNGSITFCTTGVFLRRLQTALGESIHDQASSETESFLDNITHVVMDEVHERDVETDLLLVVIKRLLAERKRRGKPEIKLVLMSATVDPTLFQNYFAEISANGRPAPVVDIPGRSFSVEKHYLDETYRHLQSLNLPRNQGGWIWQERNVRDYIQREIAHQGGISKGPGTEEKTAVDDLELPYPLIALMIADVLTRSQDGHVLVFLPGWDEIKAVHQILLNTSVQPLLGLPLDNPDRFEIHVLHSSVPVQDQQAVFEPVRHENIRRIILSTNIAETSITIPDVVYVIDSGRVKEKRYDPERHLSSLVSAWVGTSNLNQRAGRAGRHRSGEYYGVLSRARYNALAVNQMVEMKRVDLSNVVMHIKALDIPGMAVEDVLAAAIEPPAIERVRAAMQDLERIGALDYHQNLTSLGKVLLQLPLDVSIGKMCLYGAFFRCLDPVLTLAAILTNRDPFMAPIHLKKEANEIKDRFSPVMFRSDPLCVLNAFSEWTRLLSISSSQANRFLTTNMISRPTMMQILQVKQSLFQSLDKAEIIKVVRSSTTVTARYRRRVRETDPEFNINSKSTPLLCALIAVASSPNFAIRAGEKSYRTSQDKSCFVHPSSVCHAKFVKDRPEAALPAGEKEFFAFAEKVRNTSTQTSSSSGNAMTFLRGCTRLDPLTYILFGATEARALGHGLECDDWLPVSGSYDALDSLERLKAIMDACMLRVLEGIGKRGPKPNQDLQASQPAQNPDKLPSEDLMQAANSTLVSWNSDDEEGEDNLDNLLQNKPPVDLSLSKREIEEFEALTTGIVHILDQYAVERSWNHNP